MLTPTGAGPIRWTERLAHRRGRSALGRTWRRLPLAASDWSGLPVPPAAGVGLPHWLVPWPSVGAHIAIYDEAHLGAEAIGWCRAILAAAQTARTPLDLGAAMEALAGETRARPAGRPVSGGPARPWAAVVRILPITAPAPGPRERS